MHLGKTVKVPCIVCGRCLRKLSLFRRELGLCNVVVACRQRLMHGFANGKTLLTRENLPSDTERSGFDRIHLQI